MKHFTIKKILLMLFIASCGSLFQASIFAEENCCRPAYECGCNPLYCGTYTGQFHVGVAPIIWTKRGELDLLSCTANPLNPVFQLAPKLPKFNTLYKLPWIIGGILGYAWDDNIELYLEFNYLQATQKHHSTGFLFPFSNVTPTQSLSVVLNKYSLFEGYVGVRYYWDRWCDWVSPFLGVKVGFTAHRNVNAALSVNGTPLVLAPAAGSINSCVPSTSSTPPNKNFFTKNTVIAGGINGGIDICFCGGWSFVVTGEFVVSCGPRTRAPSVFVTPLPGPTFATNLILGGIGSELRFPVTFGIKRVF